VRKAHKCCGRHERYDAVADRVQSVQPVGQPISISSNCGLRTTDTDGVSPSDCVVGSGWEDPKAATWPGRSFPPLRCPVNAPFWSRAVGVDHNATCVRRFDAPPLVVCSPGPDEPSAAVGVCQSFAAIASGIPIPLLPCRLAAVARRVSHVSHVSPSCGFDAVGVGHRRAASVSVVPCEPVVLGLPPELFESADVAVGQNPRPTSPLGGAAVRRGEQFPFDIEPEGGQGAENDPELSMESRGNEGVAVFQEDESRSHHAQHSFDLGPEPSFVALAFPRTGRAERLAGESGSDEIHASTPRARVEGGEVAPHRSLIQGRLFHAGHETGRSEGVPLNCTHKAIPPPASVEVLERERHAELERSCSCAERKAAGGTCSHIRHARFVDVAGITRVELPRCNSFAGKKREGTVTRRPHP
jgi:hypothetical protein